MDKKLRLSILYVLLLSLVIGGTILISKPTDKSRYDSKVIINNNGDADITKNDQESLNSYKNEISKNEAINVFNNGKDIDLHANLIEDKIGQVSLSLAYKLNGKPLTKIIDSSNISEIRNIFRFREEHVNGYRLNNMILNKKMNKLYFSVEGKKDKKYTHTAIYSYGLKNSKIEKIIYELGAFSKFYVSPDGRYNAFSYVSCPQNISSNEKDIVVIVRCSDNKLMLNSSDNIAFNQTDRIDDLYVYSYSFIKWQSDSICELRQIVKSKDGSQKIKEQAIFYNVTSNKQTK